MNSISVCLLLLGICCLITGEWSDWRCKEQGGVCFMSRTCTPTAKFNCSKTSEVTVRDCPCVSNTSEHRGGWSDWSCKKQGEFCFKSRTCNSTADFNCSKTSEVTVTNCPCVAEWSPWGGWTCHTDQGVCVQMRTRTCISGFKGNDCLTPEEKTFEEIPCDGSCNDTDTISEHREGWSDWGCKKQGEFCFKSRTCNSTADFNCSKTSEVTVTNCPCAAEWSPWGEWTCHRDQNVCLKLRKRSCISGFKGNDCLNLQGKDYEQIFCDESCNDTDTISEHRDGWSDWGCKKQGEFCFKSRTCNSTADFNCSKTSEVTVTNCPCAAEWSPWGGWTCHTDQSVCLKLRQRTCISGFKENDCLNLQGKDYEQTFCDESCNVTSSTLAPQVAVTTSMTTTTTKELKETTVMGSIYTTPTTEVPIITSMMPSPTPSPKTSSPSTSSFNMALSQTTTLTITATSKPLGTNNSMGVSTTAYIYWLEWTDWECKNFTVCLMSRTRNCSTNKTHDCEKKLGGKHAIVELCNKEICPVNWSKWSNWTCKIEKDGTCNKTRSRKCSTGSDVQCGLDFLEHEPCDDVTCHNLYEIGQLGYCKNVDFSNCSDAGSCKNDNIQLMCLRDSHVASKICPKACGCCHVDPKWSSWSDWRCERTKTMCRMKQSRTCSTGNTTDCEGISEREAVCDESLCPEPTWESWSKWKCQLRPNNTCTMSRSRKCSNEDFCNGEPNEEDVCSSAGCPDFVGYKVDCSLHNTKSDACKDGAGCHYFANTPKILCLDDAGACPVTCGCCIPSISSVDTTTPAQSGSGGNGSNGTGSGNTTNNTIGVTTQNPSGSGGNGSNGTDSGNTTNNTIGVTTQSPSGSGGNGSNGTDSGNTTNNTIDRTTQNPFGSGGNGSNGTGPAVTTNNTIDVTTQNPSGSGGNGSNGTGPGVTENNTIGVTTQNPSGSGGNGSNGTGSGVTTNNTIDVTTHNPSGSGGNGSNGTGPGVTENNTIGVTTQNPSGSGGNGSNGTGLGVTTNKTSGVTTQNPSGSGGSGSNGTGSGNTTNNTIGVTTQNPSGSGGNDSNGTGPGVTTNNTIGVTTQNPSGSGGNGSNETAPGVTTNTTIGVTTQNPSGSGGNGSNGTGSGNTTNNISGITTQNPSGSGGNGSNGTGSGVTTNNTIGVTTQNPSGPGGNGSNGTGSGVTTNNTIGVTTQSPSGSGGNGSNGTGSGVTTNNPNGITTQNPSGSGGNGSNGTGSGVTTNNTIVVTTQNPSGSGGNIGSNGTESGVTTNNHIGVTSQNPSGSGENGSNETGSGVTTNNQIGVISQNPSGSAGVSTPSLPISDGNGTIGTGSPNVITNTPQTEAPTPSTIKTTTTTQKQPHTPTPAAVTCNVCAGPEFLCEKLFAPQTCSPPNNYCINKLTNHIDGTRMVTRHCGNFDTCYREWFLGSSDSDKCRNFEDNNIITLDFDCTYCCTSDDCNKPIKPLDKDLYKDL